MIATKRNTSGRSSSRSTQCACCYSNLSFPNAGNQILSRWQPVYKEKCWISLDVLGFRSCDPRSVCRPGSLAIAEEPAIEPPLVVWLLFLSLSHSLFLCFTSLEQRDCRTFHHFLTFQGAYIHAGVIYGTDLCKMKKGENNEQENNRKGKNTPTICAPIHTLPVYTT